MNAAAVDPIADELYALPPAGFVAARDAAAKAALERGDKAVAKAVGKLRKPTASAWAVNLLARRSAAELADAVALGDQLRAAQEELRGTALRELGARRRVVLGALVRRAEELAREAGTPLGSDAVQQVRATLTAALADPEVAARVRAGRLVKPVEQSGFGPPAEGAAGKSAPKDKLGKVRPKKTAREGGATRDDLAARRERRRVRERERARADLAAAREEVAVADAAVGSAEAALAEREDRAAELRAELREVQRAAHDASVRAAKARRKATAARDRLESAERRMNDLDGDSA
ncbi:hypothetical protein [Saccharothrix obliqua]|uniref:hypothetical protein n=1 Tax=Saccharothrix obliqua TaxID=2861747 RepID=UPI001C5EC0AB|nr:hypothetical protein [Saccharothrix obliqua]MBW4716359.1 hypothetical protein [Saccharothrix obliqua]